MEMTLRETLDIPVDSILLLYSLLFAHLLSLLTHELSSCAEPLIHCYSSSTADAIACRQRPFAVCL